MILCKCVSVHKFCSILFCGDVTSEGITFIIKSKV